VLDDSRYCPEPRREVREPSGIDRRQVRFDSATSGNRRRRVSFQPKRTASLKRDWVRDQLVVLEEMGLFAASCARGRSRPLVLRDYGSGEPLDAARYDRATLNAKSPVVPRRREVVQATHLVRGCGASTGTEVNGFQRAFAFARSPGSLPASPNPANTP
jgi:hypothetical protein